MAKKKNCIKIGHDDVFIGDQIVYDDGEERLLLKVTDIDPRDGSIDVLHELTQSETFLVKDDFSKGYVLKCRKYKIR